MAKKEITLREHLQGISHKGGSSRSPKKLAAVRENIRKALHSRFPTDPRWQPKKERKNAPVMDKN